MAAARSRFLPFLFVALVATAVPLTAAAADNQAAVTKVTNLNRKALEAYGKQDYDTARALLKEALEVCASAGLDQHPIRARSHIHFGVVAIVGFQQREAGIKQFRKALEVQPDIKLTKTLVTPDLQDAFEEAVLAGDGGGGAAAGGGADRSSGNQAVEDGGDADGAPVAKRKAPPPKKKKGDEDGDDDDDDDDKSGQKGSLFFGLGLGTGFGLASGSGEVDPGAHKLGGPGFAMAQAGHIAPEVGFFINSRLMVSAQLRYQYVTGINGKNQPAGVTSCGSPPDNYCSPWTSAVAGFAKLTYFLGKGDFRFTVGGQIGGGYIRHAVAFGMTTTDACGPEGGAQTQSCVETFKGGPFLVGPTAGFMWALGSAANLFFGVNSAVGVPNFTFNFDLTGGVGFRI